MSSSGHWLRLMDVQDKRIWACPNLDALTVAKNVGTRLTMSCEKCLVKTGMLLEDKAIICKGGWIRQPFCERAENAEFTLCFFLVAILIRRANSFDLCWCSRPLGLHLNVKRRFVPTQSDASSGSPSSYCRFLLWVHFKLRQVGRKKRAPSGISGLRLRDFYLWKRSFCNYRMFAGKNKTPFSDVFLSTDVESETLSCF